MKILTTNIVFLDIDGCLTSIDDGTYFNPDPSQYHVSLQTIEGIKLLCDRTNSKVVMSTNWRKFEPDGVWNNKYGTYHNPLPSVIKLLKDYCIGTLPTVRHINKSQALVLWIEENNFEGKFVVFDDDEREQFQNTQEYGIMNMFIKVDPQHGITSKDFFKAEKILNGK